MDSVYRNVFLQLHPYPICTSLTKCSADWKAIDIICDFNKLYYFLDGEGVLVINGDTYYPKPGQLFIIPSKVKHSYWHNIEKPVYKYWTHFNYDTSSGVHLAYDRDSVFCTPPDQIADLYHNLSTCNSYHNPLDTLTELSLFYEILRLYFSLVNIEKLLPIKQNDFVKVLNSYILKHYLNTITIKELAELVNLQPNYFIQTFKKHFKDTPINYINNLRIDKSVRLLRNHSNFSIDEIASSCGFSDSRYFSRLFKKKYGITPSMYRS